MLMKGFLAANENKGSECVRIDDNANSLDRRLLFVLRSALDQLDMKQIHLKCLACMLYGVCACVCLCDNNFCKE